MSPIFLFIENTCISSLFVPQYTINELIFLGNLFILYSSVQAVFIIGQKVEVFKSD